MSSKVNDVSLLRYCVVIVSLTAIMEKEFTVDGLKELVETGDFKLVVRDAINNIEENWYLFN